MTGALATAFKRNYLRPRWCMSPRSLVLALDFGGTKHTAAVTAKGGTGWLARRQVYSPPGADAKRDQSAMLGLAHALLDSTEGELKAIGISFGGPVDAARGVVRLSHHVPGWEESPLRTSLQERFAVPVFLANDANAAALGESWAGAGRGCSSMLYVTVSTGIGGGWVVNGRIYDGADGMAGEIGHMLVKPGGSPCACGKNGCLEAEASGPAIARRWREGSGKPSDPATCEMVAHAAAEGNQAALEILDEAARMLGIGLGIATSLMNPQRIVLGGGVTKAGDRWWRVVRQTARAMAPSLMRVDITPALLGDDAPLWGAAALTGLL